MASWYAWSNITKEAHADGRPQHLIKVGETVSEKDFPDDWDSLVSSGVVRQKPYPNLSNFDGSPNDYFKKQLAALGSYDSVEEVDPEGVQSLQEAGLLPPGVEPAKSKLAGK